MHISRNIFQLLSLSSVWIGFSSFFRPYLLFMLTGTMPDLRLCLAVGLVAFSIYSLDKLSSSREDAINTPERAILHDKPILPVAILAYALAILLIFLTSPEALPYIFLPGLAGATYVARLPWIGRPKDLPAMKNIIVGMASAACYVGLVGWSWPLFAFAFLIIFIDTVLFDIRDVAGDRENGVRTLPVMLGMGPTLAILAGLNVAALAILPAGWQMVAWGYGLIWYFKEKRDPLMLDLLVDGWWQWGAVFVRLLG